MTLTALARHELESLFHRSERLLWGLAYRMTGTTADADDVLQETFLRLLERPPSDLHKDLRPWLVRVAANLSRDRLRRRKVRGYDGPWLATPVDTERLADLGPGGQGPDARYELLESATQAFLVALEALTSRQRAVLLLRDVVGYTVRETAESLGISEDNVKTTHLRARKSMETYDRTRRPPDDARRAATGEALGRFLFALQAGDKDALLALLAPDARAISDGGGEVHAARLVVHGAERVIAFFLGLQGKDSRTPSVAPRDLNGLPAVVVDFAGEARPGFGQRLTMAVELDEQGRIGAVEMVIAPSKLGGV